jgi:hypothetical protein
MFQGNQAYLWAALEHLQARLDQRSAVAERVAGADERIVRTRDALDEAARGMQDVPALERLCRAFNLSAFERDLLLFCAAPELEPLSWIPPGAEASRRIVPTLNMAMALLPSSHWDAITPTGALRSFRLINVGQGDVLTLSPLHVDERVLHYIVGADSIDEQVARFLQPLPAVADPLPPSHRAIAEGVVASLTPSATSRLPLVQLVGMEGTGRRAIASVAAAALGLKPYVLSPPALTPGFDPELFARTLAREMVLGALALVVDGDGIDALDAAGKLALGRLIDRLSGPVIVTLRERRRLSARVVPRRVPPPPRRARRANRVVRDVGRSRPSRRAARGAPRDRRSCPQPRARSRGVGLRREGEARPRDQRALHGRERPRQDVGGRDPRGGAPAGSLSGRPQSGREQVHR